MTALLLLAAAPWAWLGWYFYRRYRRYQRRPSLFSALVFACQPGWAGAFVAFAPPVAAQWACILCFALGVVVVLAVLQDQATTPR